MAHLKSTNYNEIMSKKNNFGVLGNNTNYLKADYKPVNQEDDYFEVRLHSSCIAKVYLHKIILNSCGYRTVTTKERLNHILKDNNYSIRVVQEDFTWYLWNYEKQERYKFFDGIEIKRLDLF